jgi:hypothetical protein
MMKIEGSGSASGSGSISQRHGYADPDPHQNVMDPEHCAKPLKTHRHKGKHDEMWYHLVKLVQPLHVDDCDDAAL